MHKTCPQCGGSGFVDACPNESRCSWTIIGRDRWSCSHGVVVSKHPNAWCDGGCCR